MDGSIVLINKNYNGGGIDFITLTQPIVDVINAFVDVNIIKMR